MDIIPFAKTNYRNKDQVFGIKRDDRRRHMYVIGKTGTGKTTLLRNMMISDIRSGNGVAVIDPHGEFAETILDYIPKERINDVVYFNPADLNYPVAFNVMESVNPQERHLVASGLISIFKKIWADSWGPRLEYVLRNTILALLEDPDSTLLGIMRMFSDKDYRKSVIDKVTDPVIKAFWMDEYAKYSSKFEVEAVAPIQNKVGQFLTNPLIRNIVGQKRSAINMREMMDSRKILIMNVSKGRVGEDTAKLLGAMMITKIQQAAMSRINIPEEEREDLFLYVDEFQNFATESFADILSEARKYRLNLTLAHQYIAQLIDEVRDAVTGNIGTLVTFRVGAEDAEFFEKEFAPEITALDLVNLPNKKIYLKLMIDGVTSRAFSADTLAPLLPEEINNAEEIINLSRKKYSTEREIVEKEISEWSQPVAVVISGIQEAPKRSKLKLYDTICTRCHKKTQVPFEPKPGRDIYCKECLNIIQKTKQGEPRRSFVAQNLSDEPHQMIPSQNSNEHIIVPKASAPTVQEKDGEEVSLSEAFNKGTVSFGGKSVQQRESRQLIQSAQRQERKSPDLSGLKNILGNIESGKTKTQQGLDKKSGVLKPGESVKF